MKRAGVPLKLIVLATMVSSVTGCGQKTTVEISVQTKHGDAMRLSGARVEVAESVPPPSGWEKLHLLSAVKGFSGIVTDADGDAVIKGLKPQYFVVVSDERQIDEKTEEHLWVVAAGNSQDGRLLLNADNLAPSETLEPPTEARETTWLLTPNAINAWNRGIKYWMWAITNDYKNMAELLIANGADVNAKSDINWEVRDLTPLHIAASSGKQDIAELLLAKGADVNATASIERTPLHYAVAAGNKDIVELLLAKRANVNAKDLKGGTPLHYAAAKGDKDIIELLLANGADINAKASPSGMTPLGTAIDQHHDDIAALLRAHGAKE